MMLRLLACVCVLSIGSRSFADEDTPKIQGAWRLIHESVDGEPVAPASIADTVVLIKGSTVDVKAGGKDLVKGLKFEIDSTKTPKHVTEFPETGPNAGKTVPGLYSLDGDYLFSCMAKAGGVRPEKFSAAKGDGLTFRVYRRERSASAEKAEADELKKFEGSWAFESMSVGRNKLPAAALASMKLILKENRFEQQARFPVHGVFVLDAEAKPKKADLIFVDGPLVGRIQRVIYSLEGDVYTVCLRASGGARPTELVQKDEDGYVYEVLKRVKP